MTSPAFRERVAAAEPFTPPLVLAVDNDVVSEDAIAQQFTVENGATLKFDHDVGRWFRWDAACWRRDATDLALNYARELTRRLTDGKKSMCRSAVAAGVERFARADRSHAVTHDVWDADPFLLGTPGGTAELRTATMRDAVPDEHISKQTAVAPADGEPELWLRFLREAVNHDEAMVRFLQMWTGYCLTGDTREHALAFVYGPGGNGKSVYLNTITGIMGDYAVTSTMETFTASRNDRHSTELAMLRGARLVTASETEEGRAWAEARIKSLTGGDPISARFMRQDNFTFRPQFKLMIAGNHQPALRNVDDAMRRRFNIVPFVTKPAAPDRQLEEKLKAEWPQILAWAIEGCRMWLGEGLCRPTAVISATAQYFDDQDVFGQWFAERCITDMPGRFELVSKCYADWATFAKEHGEEPGSQKSFGAAMGKRGFRSKPKRVNGPPVKVYENLGLELREEGFGS